MVSERKMLRMLEKYAEKIRKKRKKQSRSSRSGSRIRQSSDGSRTPSPTPPRQRRRSRRISYSRSRTPCSRSRSPVRRRRSKSFSLSPKTMQSKRDEDIPALCQAIEEMPVESVEVQPAEVQALEDQLVAQTPDSYLEALGDDYAEPTIYEGTLHEGITKRWSHILINGLNKQERDTITKKHKFPNNCTLLDAPLLNDEVKAVLTESSKLRDKGLEIGQRQIGLGLAIIGKAMNTIMTEQNIENLKVQIISQLSDGTKLLSDSLYHQTKTRTKLLAPSLDKNFNQIIEKTKRDTYLFGTDLTEKIKNAKQLQQSVAHIKKPVPKTTVKTGGKANQGNKSGPSLYNKGTTSGGPKTYKPSFQKRPPVQQKQRPERTYQAPERMYQAHRSAPHRR